MTQKVIRQDAAQHCLIKGQGVNLEPVHLTVVRPSYFRLR